MSKTRKPEPVRKSSGAKSKKPTESKPGLEVINFSVEDPNWKKAFWMLIPCLLIFTWIVGWGTAFHSDEMMQNQYEKENFKFYESYGKDTSFMHFDLEDGQHVPAHLRTYGPLFDLIAVSTNKILGIAGNGYEFNTRHLWIQLFGILAVLFAGLIALELSGSYRAAIITSLIVFLTPTFFGQSLLNSKDVPFAAGYTLGIYGIILLLRDLKHVSWKSVIIFALGITCAIGTRVGGLLLFCYLGLFALLLILFKKEYRTDLPGVLKSIVPKFLIASVTGYILAVLTWPFAIMGPISNVLYSLRYVTKFQEHIPLTFEGIFTDCNHLPNYYLLKWMGMTIPTLFLVLFFLSFIYLIRLRKLPNFMLYLLVLFAVVFPIAYAWKSSVIVYSGWRQFLFIYPSAAVLMGLPVMYIQNSIPKNSYKAAFMGFLFIALLNPITWMIRNHPYEYIYFNELTGGFKNMYYDYETETWEMSVKAALDWLYKNENIQNSKDTVTIGTNAKSEATYMVRREYHDTKTKVVQTGYKGFHQVPWDYCILHILFHPPYILKNSYPPYNTIHTVYIDGMPVCAVVKAVPGRPDLEGMKALMQNNIPKADSLLSIYYSMDNKSESVMENLMLARVNEHKFKEALDVYNHLYVINPDNNAANYYAGIAYANTGDFVRARMAINAAIQNGLQNRDVFNNMAAICQQLRDTKSAGYYHQLAMQVK